MKNLVPALSGLPGTSTAAIDPRVILGPGGSREPIVKLMGTTSNVKAGKEDTQHFLAYLDSRKDIVGKKVGTTGYCMGGGMALRTAAAEPAKVAAAASFHGSNLASDAPDSPHTLAPKIKAKTYFGFAIEDRTMPQEAVERLKAAFDAAGADYEGETYFGARHGWCVKDHTVYHEHQAEHAWHHMLELFTSALK